MTAYYVDSTAIEMKLDGTNWTDVTEDVVAPIVFSYGILNNGPLDRVAGTGIMRFEMNNSIANSAGKAGYYSPGHTDCRVGFKAGCKVRLKLTREGNTYYKFHGTIPADGIKPQPGINGARTTKVEVHDWMDQAAMHALYLPEYDEDLRIDEVIPLIVANMPLAPLATEYNEGTSTFAFIFDTVRAHTKAIQEFVKLANSELGFIYVKRDKTAGETLTCEGRYYRTDNFDVETFTVPVPDTGYALMETEDYLLLETGDKIVLQEAQALTAIYNDDDMLDADITDGQDVYPTVRATVYPRLMDGSPVVLAQLNRAANVPAGETKTISAKYRDPSGGTDNVSGIDMVTPVATTDYLMNSAEDGGGSNLTTDLDVTATYGTNGVEWGLENTGASNGYVTFLQARGTGVYLYDPVTYEVSDETSKDLFGSRVMALDMKYEDDPVEAEAFASYLLDAHKDPHPTAEWVQFNANRSDLLLWTFLEIEPGDRVYLSEQQALPDGVYFVNGCEAEINSSGLINFKWHVRSAGFDALQVFILDDETAGLLDGEYLLGY